MLCQQLAEEEAVEGVSYGIHKARGDALGGTVEAKSLS